MKDKRRDSLFKAFLGYWVGPSRRRVLEETLDRKGFKLVSASRTPPHAIIERNGKRYRINHVGLRKA